MTNVKKYKHLLLEQREIIEHLLNEGKNFSQIERITGIDRTTIAKDVKKNCKLYVHKNSKTVCANQLHCDKDFCDYNKDCFESKQCELLNKAPHICNSCPKKQHCIFPKVYISHKMLKNYMKKDYLSLEKDMILLKMKSMKLKNILFH